MIVKLSKSKTACTENNSAAPIIDDRDGRREKYFWPAQVANKGSKRFLHDEKTLRAAIHYVLHKQPNPLVQYSPYRKRRVQQKGRTKLYAP